MKLSDQARVGDLLRDYETALVEGTSLATENERRLYTIHLDACRRLRDLLAVASPIADVVELLMQDQRAYGWSYLSGTHGERAERSFYAVKAMFCPDATS